MKLNEETKCMIMSSLFEMYDAIYISCKTSPISPI